MNVNDSAIGLAIAAGGTMTLTMDDPSTANGVTFTNLKYRFRHSGESGISNAWTVAFKNGAYTYCQNTTITHVSTDGYVDTNITPLCYGLLNSANLTLMNISLTNNDGAGPTTAYVRWVEVFANYDVGVLNASFFSPSQSSMKKIMNDTFIVAVNISCSGPTGASCGIPSATLFFNQSGATNPNATVNVTDGENPFGIILGGNPMVCPNQLSGGQTCTINWTLNLTGRIRTVWTINATFNSTESTILSNSSANFQINITELSPPGINFTAPAEENNTFINSSVRNNTFINISVDAMNIDSVILSWGNTNLTLESKELVMYFKFNNDTLDSSRYGSNANMNNGVNCSSGVIGRFDSACRFDGANDYIDAPGYNGSSALTITAWVYTVSNASWQAVVEH